MSNFDKYYNLGAKKQSIRHNLGTGLADLPSQYHLYIQEKLDGLEKYSRHRKAKETYTLFYPKEASSTQNQYLNTEEDRILMSHLHWFQWVQKKEKDCL